MSSELKTVIVVGGGAGALVARQLSALLNPSKHNLILVSARPHFQHYVGSIRAAVTPEGGFDEQVMMPFDKLLVNGNGVIINAEVISISESGEEGGSVTLSNGESIHWDALVLATGSTWEGPLDIPKYQPETLEWFKEWQGKFAKAKDVLLVGGGAVGIGVSSLSLSMMHCLMYCTEFAGEIKDLDPSKNVTIVHSDSMLLNKTYPDKFRKDVERRLRARDVNLFLGDIAPDDALTTSSTHITTRNGTILTPDLIIPCRGPRPNTSILSSALGPDVLTPSGHAKVLSTFQLPAHPRIFVCGDIADLNEQRAIAKYSGHADVVSKNVLALFDGQAPSMAYKGATEAIFVTIGKVCSSFRVVCDFGGS
ncbi:hypothetical protein C0995_009840 [Termitomyces sp. Mi166|nr:hypothetical protein C0995_009840 [Termitomyces sp. Mi166\